MPPEDILKNGDLGDSFGSKIPGRCIHYYVVFGPTGNNFLLRATYIDVMRFLCPRPRGETACSEQRI